MYREIIVRDQLDKDVLRIDSSELVPFPNGSGRILSPKGRAIESRMSGNLFEKGVFLPEEYIWEIVKDNQGLLVLIAYQNKT